MKTFIKTTMLLFIICLSFFACSKDDESKLSPAKFSIDQSTVDFGEVEIPTLKEIKLTVTNSGEEDLILKNYTFSGSNAAEFTVKASETEEAIESGKTYGFSVVFKPTEEGAKTAILTIITNIGEHKVNLSGSAVLGPNAIVNIPDANFKAALLAHEIDTNDDGEIQVSEAEAYKETINCSDKEIADLTGIEAFVNIVGLQVKENQLTSLDVSQNTSLKLLNFQQNKLTNLDISQNTLLEELNCSYNQLASLDVTPNIYLTTLTCANNKLTTLDVSKNILLGYIYCHENQITSLDISQNNSLRVLNCRSNKLTALNVANGNNHNMIFMSARYNNNLTCIQIDEGFTPHSDWREDVIANYSTNCQ